MMEKKRGKKTIQTGASKMDLNTIKTLQCRKKKSFLWGLWRLAQPSTLDGKFAFGSLVGRVNNSSRPE